MAIAKRDIVAGPPELKGHPLADLEQLFLERGERKYRAQQVYDALYIHRIDDVAGMHVLPQQLRDTLQSDYRTSSVRLQTVQHSEDGTKKFLFELHDGRAVESVLIPSEMREADGVPRRLTLCVSTQVGCNLGCVFCATASLKLTRNLSAGEIVDQFLQAQKHSEKPITNIVFMGMGEPIDGFKLGVGTAVGCSQTGGKGFHIIADAMGEGLNLVGLVHVPDPDGHLRDHEVVLDFIDDDVGQVAGLLGVQEALRPTVQAIGQDRVVAAIADHVHHAVLKCTDFLAQHVGLAFLQADSSLAMRADKTHGRQERGMTLEKIRRVDQKIGNVVFGDRCDRVAHSGISISPVNTVVAGPVIITDVSAPCH